MPDLQGGDWDDIWDYPFAYLVSAKDHLIQFKCLHRIYYMPVIDPPLQSAGAVLFTQPILATSSGTAPQFSNSGWCSNFIVDSAALPIPLTVSVCLLGLVEVGSTRMYRTLSTILLFYAYKAVILQWRNPWLIH